MKRPGKAEGCLSQYCHIASCCKNNNILPKCPQGSGTLRQQSLMMHGIAWYCKVSHGMACYCVVLHGIEWNTTQ